MLGLELCLLGGNLGSLGLLGFELRLFLGLLLGGGLLRGVAFGLGGGLLGGGLLLGRLLFGLLGLSAAACWAAWRWASSCCAACC